MLGLIVFAVVLAGCGKSDIVAVKRPLVPIYVCPNARERGLPRCAGRFDVGRLIGIPLDDAHRIGSAHGFDVQRGAPLTPLEQLNDTTAGTGTNLLRVECNGTSKGSIVVRLMRLERGPP
jgi:hypothetical protein